MIEALQEQQAEITQLRAMLAIVFVVALLPAFLFWKNRENVIAQ
jgi:hypothetical protein